MSVLAGRLAVVTGASRGIGAATTEALGGAGCRVVRVARSFPGEGQGGFHDVVCDLNDAAQVAALAERIARELGPPDIIVNNAGSFLLRPLERTTTDEFDVQVGINLRAPFALARAFLPMLRAVGRGSFISVGSVADHRVFGVPTFITGDRAAFIRVMTRPEGDAALAIATIERVVDATANWTDLNELKHTSISR